jgi:hypothetical protein
VQGVLWVRTYCTEWHASASIYATRMHLFTQAPRARNGLLNIHFWGVPVFAAPVPVHGNESGLGAPFHSSPPGLTTMIKTLKMLITSGQERVQAFVPRRRGWGRESQRRAHDEGGGYARGVLGRLKGVQVGQEVACLLGVFARHLPSVSGLDLSFRQRILCPLRLCIYYI